LLALAALIFSRLPVSGSQNITLAWDPNTERDLAGYLLYYGTASRSYIRSNIVAGRTQATVSNLTDGVTYYFAVKAYNTSGLQSDFSNEVSYSVPMPDNLPTFAAIADQASDEDTARNVAIQLQGANADRPMTIWATSSNPLLVPLANVVLSGSGANRLASITPARNRYGNAMITVYVSDGQSTNRQSFLFTVNAKNDAPIVTTIPDFILAPNTSRTLNFFIADVESSAETLLVTVESSDSVLLPTEDILLEGDRNDRSITFAPMHGKWGTTRVMVKVSDGQAVTERSFLVTIPAPPSIETVADLTVNEDTPFSFAVRISDPDTPPPGLTVWVESSNPSLIPSSNIALTERGLNRTATITPALNRSGAATITLLASDGISTNRQSFTVTVKPINDPPFLSVIADQTTAVGLPRAVGFLLSDAETPASNLVVTAISSDPSLVPGDNITVSGTGLSRTATIIPIAEQFGTATITLAVSDEEKTTYRSFQFAVVSTNGPLLSPITDQTLLEDVLKTVEFSIHDPDTPLPTLLVWAASSKPALIHPNSIIFAGTDKTRTAILLPSPNQSGAATLTFFVTDGAVTNSRSFVATVDAVNDPPILSAIPNQTIGLDSSLAFSFTVADAETHASNLVVTAESSNSILVPSGRIGLSGAGYNRLAILTPLAGIFGTATITLSVSDGSLVTSRSFYLTVQSVLPPPLLPANGEGEEGSSPLDPPVANPPFETFKGAYHGLFYDSDNLTVSSAGLLKLNVTSNGTFTGTLQLSTERLRFIGKFDIADRTAVVLVPRFERSPIQINLQLNVAAGFRRVTGSVTDGAFQVGMMAHPVDFQTQETIPQAGSYQINIADAVTGTIDLTAEALGYAEIEPDGAVILHGTLPDGQTFHQSAVLSPAGLLGVYLPLYGGMGCLIGWLEFYPAVHEQFFGELNWIMPTPNEGIGDGAERLVPIPIIGVRADVP